MTIAILQTVPELPSLVLTLYKGVSAEAAAGFAAMFYIGITIGRAISGFVTLKLNDRQMTLLGMLIVGLGVIIMFLPFGAYISLAGFIIIGFGCAPIYPSIIHSTPDNFGSDKSQAIIGVLMASAYVGTCVMPPFFGFLAQHISVSLLPIYLIILLLLMAYTHELMNRLCH